VGMREERFAAIAARLEQVSSTGDLASVLRPDTLAEVLQLMGFQNSAIDPELGFYAARSYSLMRPPRTGWRWIRFRERSAAG
jgi:hypothetical protein